jgi:protein O-mannosyl-transferase
LLRLPRYFRLRIYSVFSPSLHKTDPSTAFNNEGQTSRGLPFVLLSLVFLTALVVYCFGRTLTSYFLADDIGEVRYVSQIFSGQPQLFWSNFTGNYMQIPSMSVYRPTLLLTLVIDYLFWQGNAFGYYLSNLLYFTGDVFLLYFIVKSLTNSWTKLRSELAAFFSAALFAVSPLHCESISWIVGRVDSACCFFYLAAIACFLRYRLTNNKLFFAAQIIGFWLAITTKEMAIGLPVVIAAIAFCFAESNENRLKQAWLASRSLWLCTLIYFVLRFLCLGTLLGGYTGSIGASQTANALTRWLDFDTLHRLLFPFAYQIFANNNGYILPLTLCYSILAGVALVRLLSFSLPWSWLAFIGIWSLTALAPIYRLWGIGYNLEGARFCFFLTTAASCLLPILIFAPDNKNKLPYLANKLAITGALALLVITFIFARTAQATNLLWVHAGKYGVTESQRKNITIIVGKYLIGKRKK